MQQDYGETLNIAEQLFTQKAKVEGESKSREMDIELIQRLEGENERQGEYTKALEVSSSSL